jgi:hypothetical protein
MSLEVLTITFLAEVAFLALWQLRRSLGPESEDDRIED